MPRSVPPISTMKIVNEDGTPSAAFLRYLTLLSISSVIRGTGSPEGVVSAEIDSLYIDDTGSAGSIFYVKRDSDIAGDKTQGWIGV